MITDSEIGVNVQQARYRAQLTQGELGQALGVPRSTISKMENGQRAIAATELAALARYLNVTVESLLAEDQAVRARQMARINALMRAERVTADDHLQLLWFAEIAEYVRSDSFVPLLPERVLRLPPKQAGELAGRWIRGELGIERDQALQGLSALAARLGVTVVAARLPSGSRLSGCLVHVGNGRAALVNANHPHERQRFTICHEIGHAIFRDEAEALTCAVGENAGGRRSIQEVRADVFASALLMPMSLMREVGQSRDLLGIASLRAELQVSAAALLSRLTDLKILSPLEGRGLRASRAFASNSPASTPSFRTIGLVSAQGIREQGRDDLLQDVTVVPDFEVVP